MNGCVVISWGQPVRGREGKALEVFGKAVGYFDALAKSGRIHDHQEYVARTGSQGGFMILTGQYDELVAITGEEETLELTLAGSTICEDFAINLYEGGSEQAVTASMQRYAKVQSELGYL